MSEETEQHLFEVNALHANMLGYLIDVILNINILVV